MLSIKKSFILLCLIVTCCNCLAQGNMAQTQGTRQLWLRYMDKVARPVMLNIAADKLKANMKVEVAANTDNKNGRIQSAYLEAFGRTLSGIAPWLQTDGGDADEVKLRNQYRAWALAGIANAVNPQAKDYLQWQGGQPLVDASFMALALIRSPWLWQHLDDKVKQQVVSALLLTRSTVPVYSNWILFSGVIEAFFDQYDLPYDALRIEFAVREFTKHWYVGDGMYSDGMDFHADYYNSIVIQPYLAAILEVVNQKQKTYGTETAKAKLIAQRYAQIQERLINTDGSYPATGRSIVYRGGVFHHLANQACQQQLPASLTPAQVREALTAVIKKTLDAPNTFTANGWLNIGLYGAQPGLADFYITTGSLYICSNIFLPLGLPATNEFWSTPPQPWTALKIWTGQDVPADHALDLKY
ncbi:DUF2264 domain-containing protein [Inquilinus sp. KBS0705]|nr:DUF2264 domain-containing protein [Inquilinus sp. KBS0705]